MKFYPRRLHHDVPGWVEPGSVFHARLRCARENTRDLTDAALSAPLLESARFYAMKQRWWPRLFLLMPDHVHALVSFARDEAMTRVVGDWKRWHTRQHGIAWQEGFFDHRLRSDESLAEKALHSRMNPVRAGVCERMEDWPHVLQETDVT